jgi:hypothetical protein
MHIHVKMLFMKEQMMIPLPNPEDWIGISTVAQLLNISVGHARRLDGNLIRRHYMSGVSSAVYWRPEIVTLAEARIKAGLQRA